MSQSFSRSETPGGRTLWQIFWSDENQDQDDEPALTMIDASVNRTAGEGLHHYAKPQVPPGVASDSEDDVVFDQKRELQSGEDAGVSYKSRSIKDSGGSDYAENDWESVDMSSSTGLFTGHNLRTRKDSDDSLMLGPTHHSLGLRFRWFFINCRNPMFWQENWWVPLVIVGACLIYAIVTTVIVKTLTH